MLTVHLVADYAVFLDQFSQPSVNQLRCIVIVGEKKAREHSRGSAKPPRIIGDCPKLDEAESGIAGNSPHAFALRELRFDRSDAGHFSFFRSMP